MKIELRQPYKSIQTLETEELPDFAILIGRNGAGKSQILNALKEGQAVIPGMGVDEIELYDIVSFSPPKAGRSQGRYSRTLAQATAEAYLLSNPGGEALIDTAAEIFDKHSGDIESNNGVQARETFVSNLRDEIRHLPDFAVFAVDAQESPYKKELYERVVFPILPERDRNRDNETRRPPNGFNGNLAALLSAAMKKSGKLPHELTHDDIMRALDSSGETLANLIDQAFTSYKSSQYEWAHKRIETEYIEFFELMTEYRTKYPPPWVILRGILSEMRYAAGDSGLFDFEFTDPDHYELRVSNFSEFAFKTQMTNRTTSTNYELDSLSSGEKILMALCLVSFNQYLGQRRPKLLLLDELDAMLHPSMVAAMVAALKTLFVEQGTKVLMTSHSPMSVAAVGETDIFRVSRTGGQVKVSHTTRMEAVNELSEGLASIDVGLRIAASDEAKVTILTEGHNTKHLKRWVELNFPEDVHVFEELEQHTNDQQLLEFGRLLGKMNTNTHFVIVWDCDAAGKAQTLRTEMPDDAKITPYAFEKRPDNAIASRGIENNYDEVILEPYSSTTTGGDGSLLGRGFQSSLKAEFANHVLQHGTSEYFTNFQELHDIVSEVLSPTGEEPPKNAPQH